jgi:hypothetical protein
LFDIPETSLDSIQLNVVPDIGLTNYIKSDKFYFDIQVKTDGINLQNVTLGIHSEVFVDAKILGI